MSRLRLVEKPQPLRELPAKRRIPWAVILTLTIAIVVGLLIAALGVW